MSDRVRSLLSMYSPGCCLKYVVNTIDNLCRMLPRVNKCVVVSGDNNCCAASPMT